MRISLKSEEPRARVVGICPEIILGIVIVAGVLDRHFDKPCVITSGVEGSHSRASLHYAGRAVDIRSRFFTASEANDCAAMCREALGEDFDFIIESDHFHLEWQPKRGVNL